MGGSRRLPCYSRQPPPVGAQAALADLGDEPALENVENFFFTFFHPQCGHSGIDWFRLSRSFSNVLPHFGQAYSKIGIAEGGYSLLFGSDVICLAFPDGDCARGAHVNLDRPGTRGAIKYQKIKNPAMRANGK